MEDITYSTHSIPPLEGRAIFLIMPQSPKALKSKTTQLYSDPHNPFLHLERGLLYERLGFPDLAAADAYRALSLFESVVDPDGCEFHARRVVSPDGCMNESFDCGEEQEEENESVPITRDEHDGTIGKVYILLVRCLVRCGCLRDAYEFCGRGIVLVRGLHGHSDEEEELRKLMREIKRVYLARMNEPATSDQSGGGDGAGINPSILPAQGFARRVLYPWNEHEPDRKAPETLRLLNKRLKDVAPKCEVRAVALPALHANATTTAEKDKDNFHDHQTDSDVSIQLGLFAKEDIKPGEILLRESSLLTATNRLHDDLCDACNAPLPDLSAVEPPVPCEDCDDTIFCSRKCHDQAQQTYHGAICGLDGLQSIGKDIPDPKDKADYLYLLLLGRALAMSATQDVHPLELPEVKYIWGDFHDYDYNYDDDVDANIDNDPSFSLPFSFHLNILQPMRLLEEMALDPFVSLPRYDTWILNTLYAKFRGTASGRLSTWDGGPEVCAVHPLWCLANHSCDPNVRWEWGGEITFMARGETEKAVWAGLSAEEKEKRRKTSSAGIRADEEILNHYCDIGLDVKQRRGWARGALGGLCLCERCVWESGEGERAK